MIALKVQRIGSKNRNGHSKRKTQNYNHWHLRGSLPLSMVLSSSYKT